MKKVSFCETVACALIPCVVSRYKTAALKTSGFGFGAYRLAEDLQATSVFMYLSSVVTATLFTFCYDAKGTLPKYALGCAALSFGYISAVAIKWLYSNAVKFRNDYYLSEEKTLFLRRISIPK
jgi:hypothetical protein